MRKIISGTAAIVLLLQIAALGQTASNSETSSLYFISGRDTSSFDLGTITVNTEEKATTFNYYKYYANKRCCHAFLNISGGGAVKNSIAAVVDAGNIAPEGTASLRMGIRPWHHEDYSKIVDMAVTAQNNGNGSIDSEEMQKLLNETKRWDVWLVAGGGVSGKKFKSFSPDSAFNAQIKKISYTSCSFNVGFNYWSANYLSGVMLAGATIGVDLSDNFDDLDEATKEDVRTSTDSVSGQVRKVNFKETVFLGQYKKDVVTFPLNMEVYYSPNFIPNIAILASASTTISSTELPKTKAGVGLFFLKGGRPTAPIAGIMLSYKDVFNNDKTDDYKGNGVKFSLALTTRINILKSRP